MKIFYLVGFGINGAGGKSRATRQKIKYLINNNVSATVRCFSPSNKLPLVLSLIILEVYVSMLLIFQRPETIISRGCVGVLPRLVCKLLKVSFVREVHADINNEISLIRKDGFVMALYVVSSKIVHYLDLKADMIIFNHPSLLDEYKKKYSYNKAAFYSYNGFDPDFLHANETSKLVQKYGLPDDRIILCFTGSVSSWHGVDYVYEISKILAKVAPEILIVIAGGKVPLEYISDNLINVSPLDSAGCDEIIQLSDACLLPVKKNRTSPGSPLKLYDYIKYQSFVFAQSDTLGYSDEVALYSNGLSLDFSNCGDAAHIIAEKCKQGFSNDKIDVSSFTWNSRMECWIRNIELLNEKNKE